MTATAQTTSSSAMTTSEAALLRWADRRDPTRRCQNPSCPHPGKTIAQIIGKVPTDKRMYCSQNCTMAVRRRTMSGVGGEDARRKRARSQYVSLVRKMTPGLVYAVPVGVDPPAEVVEEVRRAGRVLGVNVARAPEQDSEGIVAVRVQQPRPEARERPMVAPDVDPADAGPLKAKVASRDQRVLTLVHEYTQAEVARIEGISRERVRQIVAAAAGPVKGRKAAGPAAAAPAVAEEESGDDVPPSLRRPR